MAYDLERSFYPHFIDPISMKELWDSGVRAEWFYDPKVRTVFEFALTYYIGTNFQDAPDKALLEGKFPYIIADWEAKRSLGVLVPDLKQKHQQNAIDASLKTTAERALEDPQLAIREGTEALIRLQRESATRERFNNYGETFEKRIDDYLAEVVAGGYEQSHTGFPLFCDEITEHTYGILPGELAFLIGAANGGKSFFLGHQALYAAQNGIRTYYASLENPPDMTMMRLDCLLSGVPYQKYERGLLNRDETTRLENAKNALYGLGDNLIIDMPSLASERTITDIYAKAKYEGADLIVGDQIDWLTSTGKGSSDYTKRMEKLIEDLTFATRESGLAAIWGGQFNRTGAKKEGRKSLFDLAGTSFLEKHASMVFSISAEEQHQEAECVVFDILKARRSKKGAYLLNFALSSQTLISFNREWDGK